MKLDEYDLMDGKIINIYQSNLSTNGIIYHKDKKVFVPVDIEYTVPNYKTAHEAIPVLDLVVFKEATKESVKALDPSWLANFKEGSTRMDSNSENLGVMFGILGIIGHTVAKGHPMQFVAKFKDGTKMTGGIYSKLFQHIKEQIKV